MRKQDKLSLLITFIVGLAVGFYLYFAGFLPQFGAYKGSTDFVAFELRGEAYGGCERGGVCASLRVLADGSYQAFPSVARGGERLRREGVLSSEVRRALADSATTEALEAQAAPRPGQACLSAADGTDYRVRLTLNGTQYTLDTCATAVERSSELWRAIDHAFDTTR